MLLRKRLPIKDRVELYDKVARKVDTNPFAAMRALERADELDGIITAKDQTSTRQTTVATQPLISLPPGTSISLHLESSPLLLGSDSTRSQEEGAVNITPDAVTDEQ